MAFQLGPGQVASPTSGHLDQASASGTESAPLIEAGERWFVVHMYPLHSRPARFLHRLPHERRPDPLAPPHGIHGGIEEERVRASVPREIHKANERFPVM